MKTELTTTIKWHLATEVKPGDDVHTVIAFMINNYIATLSVCQGHFNCSYVNDIGGENEFIPGKDILYWAYLPNQLTTVVINYKKRHSKNE